MLRQYFLFFKLCFLFLFCRYILPVQMSLLRTHQTDTHHQNLLMGSILMVATWVRTKNPQYLNYHMNPSPPETCMVCSRSRLGLYHSRYLGLKGLISDDAYYPGYPMWNLSFLDLEHTTEFLRYQKDQTKFKRIAKTIIIDQCEISGIACTRLSIIWQFVKFLIC